MNNEETLRQVMRNKQLASLGDAFVNFVYSLALTQANGKPQSVKVSDRILANAFKLSGLRKYLGTRISKKDLANASESLLVDAYQKKLITIEESVRILSEDPNGLQAGLSQLMKLTAERIARS
ncbi:MAG: ribonuclease III family protein [Candidatus Bathyarchaeia archaeon]